MLENKVFYLAFLRIKNSLVNINVIIESFNDSKAMLHHYHANKFNKEKIS